MVSLHSVSDNDGCRAAHAHFTVDEHFGTGFNGRPDVFKSAVPVLEQLGRFVVVNPNIEIIKLI